MSDSVEPAGISIPFASLPDNLYIRGPEYKIVFDQFATPEVWVLKDPEPGPFNTLPYPKMRQDIELEAKELSVKRTPYMLEFFAYETIGPSVGNVAGLERVDFT